MLRPPPSSTLFPYTTLFRSQVARQDVIDDLHVGRIVEPVLDPLHLGDPGDMKVDRKSTRLNSSHLGISYAVFCLKKKKFTQALSNTQPPQTHKHDTGTFFHY